MNKQLFSAEHYTSDHIFALEKGKLFSDTWHFCGLAEDLSQANEYITVQAGNNNLLVYLNEHGELKALHNICRHRGMQLVEGKGKLKRNITCPYHDWTYHQDGALKSLPKLNQEFAGIDKQCLSLKPALVGIWRGMIWVHPNPNAVSLEEFFKPMQHHLAPYDVETLTEAKGYLVEEVINANWKLVVENYIDHYHLAQLHASTLAMYDHAQAEFGYAGDHYYFWEPLSDDYRADIAKNSPYPLLMPKEDNRIGAWVPMLFPCTGLAESESSWSVFQIIPLAVDKTKVVIRSKVKDCTSLEFLKQAASSYGYWQSKVRGKYRYADITHALGSGDFMKEDIYVCEQLQKSLNSPYFEFGPSAEHGERPIREFQKRVWQYINKT